MWATSGVLWCMIGLLTVGVGSQGMEQQEDLVPLQCILLENIPQGCTNVTVAEAIPERLKELYLSLNDETKEQFKRGNLRQLSRSRLLEIPLQLIYLIPTHHLQTLPGDILASLVKKYSNDPVATRKCVESVSIDERESFLKNLQEADLSEDVQLILAEALVTWYPHPDIHWKFDLLSLVKKIGNPLLAYLPPHFLFNLSRESATKFLFHMRDWKDFSGNGNFPLNDKPWTVKRVWSYLTISEGYPSKLQNWTQDDLERYGFLLSGAMPDELQLVQREEGSFQIFTNLELGKMQVRSLLQSFFTNSNLGPVSFEKVRPVLHHMAPRDFLRFLNKSIDFSTILSSTRQSTSLPTAKQIVELLIAQLVIDGKLPSTNASTWGENIRYLGKLVYALPNSVIKLYNVSLPMTVLAAIDSEDLTMTQAQYLAASSNSSDVLQLKGLMNSLKASTLSTLNLTNLPQLLLNHILSNLPDGSLARSFVVLQKVRNDLNADRIRAMLLNKNPNQFFGLLSSLECSASFKQMKALLQTIKEEPLKQSAKKLSPLMLSVFLSTTLKNMAKDSLNWTLETITSSSSGLHIANVGITCNDVAAMEAVDLVSIFATINEERKRLHKAFPKELQYCSQKALLDLLVMKRDLRQMNKTGSLQSFLEPIEINAFGGYVLASFPKTTIQKSDISGVIQAIGSLSIPEILLASSNSNPDIYTKIYVDKLLSSNERFLKIDARELFTLGNLVFFLDVASINSIRSKSFKFFVEFLKPRDKTLCAGTQARNAWNRLIVSAFGNPHTWTSGTVATLGDLLIVLNEDQLEHVPSDSWILASDVLVEHTSYHTPMDWPGEPTKIPYVQVCLKFLDESDHSAYVMSVHKLVRRYLVAAQKLLNTVLPASELLNIMPKPASKPELRAVNVPFGQPIPEIEIIPELTEEENEDDLKERFTESSRAFEEPAGMESAGHKSVEDQSAGHKSVEDQSAGHKSVEDQSAGHKSVEDQSAGHKSVEDQSAGHKSVEDQSAGHKSVEDQSAGHKSVEDQSAGHKSVEDQSAGHKSVEDQSAGHKSVEDQSAGHKSVEDQSAGHKSVEDQSAGHKSVEDQSAGHKSVEDQSAGHKSVEDQSAGHKSVEDQSAGHKSVEDQSAGHKSVEDQSAGHKSVEDQSAGHKSVEDQSAGHKSVEDQSAGHKSVEDQSAGHKSVEDQSAGHKSVEDQSAGHKSVEDQSAGHQSVGRQKRGVNVTGELLRGIVKRQKPNFPQIHGMSVGSEELSRRVMISCDAIKTAGHSASIALEPGDIAQMSPEELNDCVETLGSLELATDAKEKFWTYVVKENISIELESAGHLLSSIPAEEVSKLNFTFPSSLEIFAGLGAEVTNKTVLIAHKFLDNNEEPTKWNVETIAAMGHMMCKLEKSYLERSLGRDDIFVQTSVVIGKMLFEDCPRKCLEDLARIAQKRTSYGKTERWTAEDLTSLGVIVAGLKTEDLTNLKSTASNNPLVGLQPSAVKCMQPSSFQALTAEQISSLSPMAAAMVDSEKKEILSFDQMTALKTVLLQAPKKELLEGLQTSEGDSEDGAGATTETNLFLLLCTATTLIAYLLSSVHF